MSALAGNNAYEMDKDRLFKFDFSDLDEGRDYNTNIQEKDVQVKGHAFSEAGVSYGRIVYSDAKLDTVVSILQSDPDLQISIGGHTDNVGSVTVNETLSNKRAEAVKNYLVSKGVAGSRIRASGFGSSKPVAPNSTPAGRAKNRKVELHLSY